MNNPNPFIPQGSLLQQKNRRRTRFQVAVFSIFAFNILVITPMLIQGCKRDSSADTTSNPTPPVDTGAPVAAATDTNNAGAAALPTPTNPVAATPTTPPPPPPPANTAGTEYVIVKGDTLDAIHKKFNVSVKAIEDANPGLVPTKLQPGHKITIPPATTPTAAATSNATVAADGSELYVVKSGDSLSKIATNHHTSVKAIQTLNNLKTTRINVGDKLKMPPPSAPATPPAPATPAPAAPATPAAPTAPPQ